MATIAATATTTPPVSTTQTRVGHVVVQAPCASMVLADWAVQTMCATTITNDGFQRVIVSAQPVVVDPAITPTMQPGATTWTLSPGQTITLPAPPEGWAWVIVDLSEAEAKRLAWGVIAAGTVGTGFAVYGIYAATVNLVHWLKRRQSAKGGR